MSDRRTIGSSDNSAVLGGMKAKNNGRYNGNGRHWQTPPEIFDPLHAEFDFTLDPCCTVESAKCASFFTDKLMEFEQARRADGVTASTIRRDLACLSSIFSSCEEWEWVASNPVKPFLRGRKKKGLVEGESRTRYLSHDEEAEIIRHAPPKAQGAIIIAIDTGLRKEELHALEWSWVNFRAREITIPAEVTKSKVGRTVPLLPRSYNLLKAMEKERGTSPFVFVTYEGKRYSEGSPYHYEALQKAVRRAGKARGADLEHVQWHDLRRTCGCRLLQDRKFRLEDVAKWLGHSSVKVTESRYAFLNVAHLHRAVAESEGKVVALHG